MVVVATEQGRVVRATSAYRRDLEEPGMLGAETHRHEVVH
jgi:hypothetical protein